MKAAKALLIVAIGASLIIRIIVDIWPFLVPGRIGAKIAAEGKTEQERHPVSYWIGRILMMVVGTWVIIFGILLGISN